MPLFGGSNRPKLDGLTKDEEKRRDCAEPRGNAPRRREGRGGARAGRARRPAREGGSRSRESLPVAAAPGAASMMSHAPLHARRSKPSTRR